MIINKLRAKVTLRFQHAKVWKIDLCFLLYYENILFLIEKIEASFKGLRNIDI